MWLVWWGGVELYICSLLWKINMKIFWRGLKPPLAKAPVRYHLQWTGSNTTNVLKGWHLGANNRDEYFSIYCWTDQFLKISSIKKPSHSLLIHVVYLAVSSSLPIHLISGIGRFCSSSSHQWNPLFLLAESALPICGISSSHRWNPLFPSMESTLLILFSFWRDSPPIGQRLNIPFRWQLT